MPLFSRRRLFAGFAAIGAVAGVFGIRTASARYYDGPVSDHFDGTRFFDPYSSPPKSVTTLFRWYTTREKAPWPEWAPSPYSDTPPARVDGAEWRLSYVGHASWLLQTAGPQHPDRSGLVGARLAGQLHGTEAGQRSRHRLRCVAADRRRARVALSLRPSRRRDAGAACTRHIGRASSRRSATTPS